MKGFNLSTIIVIMSGLLTGCGKSSDPAILNCQISTSKYTTADAVETTTYAFNASGQVASLSYTKKPNGGTAESYSITLTYNASGLVTEWNYSHGGKIVVTYNTSKQRIKREDYDGPDFLGSQTFEYNTTGQVVKRSYFDASNTLYNYIIYSYPNTTTGNFTKMEVYLPNDERIEIDDFSYDDKKVKLPDLGVNMYLTNNVTARTLKDGTGLFAGRITNSYQYNEQGYPTKVTGVIAGSSTGGFIEEDVYTCK